MSDMRVVINLVYSALEIKDFISAHMAMRDVYKSLNVIATGAFACDVREATNTTISQLNILMSKLDSIQSPEKVFRYIMSVYVHDWLIPYIKSSIGTTNIYPKM